MDPNSPANFFLELTNHQSKIVVGVVVAFVIGMLWQRATAAGGLAAILSGVLFGFGTPWVATRKPFRNVSGFVEQVTKQRASDTEKSGGDCEAPAGSAHK